MQFHKLNLEFSIYLEPGVQRTKNKKDDRNCNQGGIRKMLEILFIYDAM